MDNTIAKMKNILMGCAVAVTLSATLALTSCSDELELAGDTDALRVEVEDGWSAQPGTRTVYSNNGIHTEFEAGDAIGVYAFDGSSYTASNVKFTKQADGSWLGETKVKYDPSLTYYAYYPYDASNSGAGTYTPKTDGTVNEVDKKFADFITDASSVFWKSDQSTKANFDQSNLMIAKGTLTDVIPVVKFTLDHKRGLAVIEGSPNKWYYTDDADTKYSTTVVSTSGNKPYADGTGYSYFLTMPSVETSIVGKKVILDKGDYVIVGGAEITGTPTFTYSTSSDGGTTWSEYSSDKPSWITVTSVAQADGTPYFSVQRTSPTIETAGQKLVDNELKAKPAVSNVDLSMVNNDGSARSSRTTANCYLVHAPGTYRIPLVYGNAIKNGETNTSAYHTDVVNDNVKQNLVNHLDANITDPWIKNNSINVDGAKLIWQDMKGMISSVGIDGDYLTFTVDADNIAEGNAVISATASGIVVWSWHIWVTKQTLSTTTAVNTGSHTYYVSDVNLGAVDAAFFHNRCRVRATDGNGVMVQFEPAEGYFTGEGNDAQHSVINTYYQWGRSVAEPPATTSNLFSDGEKSFTLSSKESESIGSTIQNPGFYYYNWSNYDPYNEGKYNYWDMNQSEASSDISSATVKTVYDPCPPGYCVPTSNLYYYMKQNSSSASWKDYEVGVTDGGPGILWTKDTPNIFFPASDYRIFPSGSFTVNGLDLSYAGNEGYYWSSTPFILDYDTSSYGLSFSFMGGSLLMSGVSGVYRATGYLIRPVSEE